MLKKCIENGHFFTLSPHEIFKKLTGMLSSNVPEKWTKVREIVQARLKGSWQSSFVVYTVSDTCSNLSICVLIFTKLASIYHWDSGLGDINSIFSPSLS